MSDPILGHGATPGSITPATPGGSTGRTVACLFASRAQAEKARDALIQAGTPDTAVTLTSQETGTSASHEASESGGVWETLKRVFTGDDAESYYEGINRGQTLLSVRAQSADDADRIIEILDRFHPVDLDAQESGWRLQGWTGRHAEGTAQHAAASGAEGDALGTTTVKPLGPTAATTDADLAARATASQSHTVEGEQVIPVVEERLKVGKREAGRGSVRIRAYTVETPVEEDVRLREERVRVERRPVDREVAPGDAEFRDRTVELTESREEAVVQKSARVTEEVVVGKDVEERTEHVSDTVRRTEVEVERGDTQDRPGTTGPATGAPDDIPPRR